MGDKFYKTIYRCTVCKHERSGAENIAFACPQCRPLSPPQETFAVHRKCGKWHALGTPCGGPPASGTVRLGGHAQEMARRAVEWTAPDSFPDSVKELWRDWMEARSAFLAGSEKAGKYMTQLIEKIREKKESDG